MTKKDMFHDEPLPRLGPLYFLWKYTGKDDWELEITDIDIHQSAPFRWQGALERRLIETYAEMLYVYHIYHEGILSPQWVEMSDDRQPWLDRAEKELRETWII